MDYFNFNSNQFLSINTDLAPIKELIDAASKRM